MLSYFPIIGIYHLLPIIWWVHKGLINYYLNKERNTNINFFRILGMIDIIFYHKVKNENLQYKYTNYLKIFKYIETLSN